MHRATTHVHHDDRLVLDRRHMPYQLDEGTGYRARIGLIVLATDQTIEYEFRRMLALPGVALYESRLANAPTITPESLQAMQRDIPTATALLLPNMPLDVVAYACTSGAMVIGDDNVRDGIWQARPGIAWTTPMAAAYAAFKALAARRICFIAPYVDAINRAMRRSMQEAGFEVPVMGSWNLADDTTVARIAPTTIRQAVLELGRSEAVDTVFVACTSLRVADAVEALEQELGRPVTSSNHALAWHCLRLAGYNDPVPGFGRLFTRRLTEV
ncbi:MAG: aspartate/glutamate racemase family protein [Nitrospinae bacterium]|nr:aspartate/glutamate racemase family protein [Nitrospinota bacterium]